MTEKEQEGLFAMAEKQRDRIKELEDAMRQMKKMNVNLLTVLKEYAGMILQCYSMTMGQRDAEIAALALTEKYKFEKDKETEN